MSSFRPLRPHRTGRLAVLLTLAPMAGCARPPLMTVRTTIGPLNVAGTLGSPGAGVGHAPRRSWPRTAVSASAAQVLTTADRYLGTRYRYGGESPGEGFDCSGFVQFVYGRHGVELPRTSAQQASAGRAAPRELAALRPGDLMFFATGGGRIDHVAIYAGGGRVIHATSGAGTVRYDELDSDRGEWLLKRFMTSRRVLPA